MYLHGFVKGLKIKDDYYFWIKSSLYYHYHDKASEITVTFSDVCDYLCNFLRDKAHVFKDDNEDKKGVSHRIISLAELKMKYCMEKDKLDESLENGGAPFIQFRICEQLMELIRRIEMIAELSLMADEEIYLQFDLM